MEIIKLTKDNIIDEHICCAISKNTDPQVWSKKLWLKDRFDDGLMFLKSSERGKCFIEYIPAERAWVPVDAPDYMYIDCLWVSGSLKGHGYSNELLEACIEDSLSKGKKGLCILSSSKKRAFLADPKYLKYKKFSVCDESDCGIQLWYLPLTEDAKIPQFKDRARHPHVDHDGVVIYYTSQCPFNAKYVPLLQEVAEKMGAICECIHIDTVQKARGVPAPQTTFALFIDGEYITNEIQSPAKFEKLLGDKL